MNVTNRCSVDEWSYTCSIPLCENIIIMMIDIRGYEKSATRVDNFFKLFSVVVVVSREVS